MFIFNETAVGYFETRQNISEREAQEERARQRLAEANRFITDRYASQVITPPFEEYSISTRLDWSQAAIDAARLTGVRLRLRGIGGDTVMDNVRLDLVRMQRVTIKHIVPENWVQYTAIARNPNHYKSFVDELNDEIDIGLLTNRFSVLPPEIGEGFWRSSTLGRLFSRNSRGQGNYIA